MRKFCVVSSALCTLQMACLVMVFGESPSYALFYRSPDKEFDSLRDQEPEKPKQPTKRNSLDYIVGMIQTPSNDESVFPLHDTEKADKVAANTLIVPNGFELPANRDGTDDYQYDVKQSPVVDNQSETGQVGKGGNMKAKPEQLDNFGMDNVFAYMPREPALQLQGQPSKHDHILKFLSLDTQSKRNKIIKNSGGYHRFLLAGQPKKVLQTSFQQLSVPHTMVDAPAIQNTQSEQLAQNHEISINSTQSQTNIVKCKCQNHTTPIPDAPGTLVSKEFFFGPIRSYERAPKRLYLPETEFEQIEIN